MPRLLLLSVLACLASSQASAANQRPHIVLVMADDMGWGQTGYRGHPLLKTPHLDAMAAGGLRFERFYAGGPVCSPTRATVLTGRTHDRTGVPSHGHALRLQEKTIAQALQAAGYVTGHFGKWHLNGLRGPGAPVLASDLRHPGKFGFEQWLSVTNFFDRDPVLSRQGKFEEFEGDSSEVVMSQAIRFLEQHQEGDKPVFAVVWFGTPHGPFRALEKDVAQFGQLDSGSAHQHGELVAMDRSIGTLRRRLRELGMADNTLLVFCSDNGGLGNIQPDTVGGLRGNKGTLYEGGLRVPGIIEWPAVIQAGRITHYPACTMDLFPTVVDILGQPTDVMVQPIDGRSLKPLFTEDLKERDKPIGFRYANRLAMVDNRYKLISSMQQARKFELYDLESDPAESRDLAAEQPEIAQNLERQLLAWNESVQNSVAGKDYPEGRVEPADPKPLHWADHPDYVRYFDQWRERPEYRSVIQARQK